MARAKPKPPAMSKLEAGTQTRIEAPPGCTATVLLKAVERNPSQSEVFFALWLLVGRAGENTAAVDFTVPAGGAIRFDIPADTLVTPEYLQEYLEVFIGRNPLDRPDTPIIKG